MNLTFYEFIRKFTNEEANDPVARLANTISQDQAFPKHEENFDILSDYIEHDPKYTKMITTFDDIWQKYQYEL